jgi:hypothetical protein
MEESCDHGWDVQGAMEIGGGPAPNDWMSVNAREQGGVEMLAKYPAIGESVTKHELPSVCKSPISG